MKMAAHREAFVPLPAADGTHTPSKVDRNLLPGFEPVTHGRPPPSVNSKGKTARNCSLSRPFLPMAANGRKWRLTGGLPSGPARALRARGEPTARFGVLVEAQGGERAHRIPSAWRPTLLVEVRVQSLALDRTNNTPVVILREMDGERVLPIWIGPSEATSPSGAPVDP